MYLCRAIFIYLEDRDVIDVHNVVSQIGCACTLFFLTLYVQMDSSVCVYTIIFGWSIVSIEGPQHIILKLNIVFTFLKTEFVLENSAYPNAGANVYFSLRHSCADPESLSEGVQF